MERTPGFLLLEDGTLFRGRVVGRAAPTVAEVVFTTNMTGYQEVFSDPSYRGQIVVMTAPMIGNYGVNEEDPESSRPQVAGVVVRELSPTYSNWRASGGLAEWLATADVPVLADVDTRRLTRHLRSVGVMRGVIGGGEEPTDEARAALDACPSMEGLDLASRVSTREPYAWGDPRAAHHIVAYDYGIKRNILRLFDEHGCRITVVPADTPPEAVLAHEPDGVFLSNGPGDPRPSRTRRPRSGRSPTPRCRCSASASGTSCSDSPTGVDGEDAVRPPRREPPGARPGHRSGAHHVAEPRLRGRRGRGRDRRRAGARRVAPQPQRRLGRGAPAP
jgi:carbamoyl-phosphate synthase small subunit